MTCAQTVQTLGSMCSFCSARPLHVNKFGQIGSHCGDRICMLAYKRACRDRYIEERKAKGLTLARCPDGKVRWLNKEQLAEMKSSRPKKRYPSRRVNVGSCIVPGCAEKAHAKRMCTTHYIRKHKGDPNWNRLKTYRRKRGTVSQKMFSFRPSKHVEEAMYRACEELGTNVHQFVGQIMSLWERQYAAGGYVAALSPGNIIDPKSFYETKRHMRT
jgi:hypothetical protein